MALIPTDGLEQGCARKRTRNGRGRRGVDNVDNVVGYVCDSLGLISKE